MIYFLIGCCLGSFFCLLAQRIPVNQSIIWPSSHCSHCHHPLKWFELVPILSIFFLRFRCRYCHCFISPVYVISECVMGTIFYFSFSAFYTFSYYQLLLLCMAITLSLTDYFYMIVEPKLFYFFAFLIIIMHIVLKLPFAFQSALLIFIFFFFYQQLSKETIGGGDVRLIVFWTLLLGFEKISFLLFFASLSGIFFWLGFQLLGYKIQRLPFVPFLSLGLLLLFYLL